MELREYHPRSFGSDLHGSGATSASQAIDTALGQLSECSGKIQLHQHHLHLYSVSIYRNSAWLLFWDRTSLVVSEEIDLLTEGWKVLNFFSRLSKMTPEQPGFDPTVSLASQSEVDEVVAFIPTVRVDHIPEFLEEAILDKTKQPRIGKIYKLQVKNGDGIDHFLIGYHHAEGLSATGRPPRGYVAYDLGGNKAVFLKDSWRQDLKSAYPEHEVYKKVKDKQVRFVANALCGGDVGDGADRIHSQPSCARIHYRIVLQSCRMHSWVCDRIPLDLLRMLMIPFQLIKKPGNSLGSCTAISAIIIFSSSSKSTSTVNWSRKACCVTGTYVSIATSWDWVLTARGHGYSCRLCYSRIEKIPISTFLHRRFYVSTGQI
ncbi:unnamed protein product [Somion occarium]|uniref:Fungal-type protein kinase domain-containing protein n=1 Tax=Somion occarium TaxID=3059160 RepID=A0ABP1DEC9_9APHY